MAFLKNRCEKKEHLARMKRKRNPPVPFEGMQTGADTVEDSVDLLQKLKIELPYYPVIELVGIYPSNR